MARARILFALVLAAVATVLIAPAASAAPVSDIIDGITYHADDGDIGAGATVWSWDGHTTDVVIPASVNIGGDNYAVTTVRANAFGNFGLTSLVIPNSVTTIGSMAFHLNALTSVTIPDSVTFIADSVFADNQLSSVTFGNAVTTIGDNAFQNNLLTSIAIPSTVTVIGNDTFGNNLLTSVTIPSAVTFIGNSAFASNPGLANVKFLGTAPTLGSALFGATGTPDGPLISYYLRNAGAVFTTPTWSAGNVEYDSQALATVTFDANGHGIAPAATDVVVGQSVANPGSLTAAGYTFKGWFAAASGGTAVVFPNVIAGDTTLYAQWSVATAVTATGSNLATTGSSDTLPLGVLAFLLVGAGAAIIMRQRRSA